MRIFITGASGYVGSVVCEKAVAAGHKVVGLARSESSANKLRAMNVTPLNGTLESLDVLEKAAAEADAVLHLGFVHEFDRPYDELIAIDIAAMQAMGRGLKGTNKPLVMTSGTGVVAAASGKETDEESPLAEGMTRARVKAENAALELTKDGIRAIVVRLSPFVYGRGGSYFVPITMQGAAKYGVAPYVGDGTIMTSACDVDCAADLYLLAAEKGKAGAIFNCTTETDVRLIDLAKTIGTAVSVAAKSVAIEKVNEICGPFTAHFIYTENRASSAKAHKELGWAPKPKHKLLDDIQNGSYKSLAQQLKAQVSHA